MSVHWQKAGPDIHAGWHYTNSSEELEGRTGFKEHRPNPKGQSGGVESVLANEDCDDTENCVFCEELVAPSRLMSSTWAFTRTRHVSLPVLPTRRVIESTCNIAVQWGLETILINYGHVLSVTNALKIKRNDRDFTKVITDVEQCPDSGGPREYAYTSLADELLPPWSLRRRGLHELELSGRSAWLDEYFSRRDCTNSNVAYSKICENSVSISRIEPTVQSSLAYPTVGVCCVMYRFNMTFSSGENMTLHQPKGHSLPKNKYFKLMLKRALSTHLACNHFVRMVIRCSEFCRIDGDGRQMNVEGSGFTHRMLPTVALIISVGCNTVGWPPVFGSVSQQIDKYVSCSPYVVCVISRRGGCSLPLLRVLYDYAIQVSSTW
ncbi:hypothetical protein F5141DRAFT_1201674 [Pisolithus sp. B1]|nr:hypothetical protein F5141DRAFT_1201674 [Pisolithus sp. B1]